MTFFERLRDGVSVVEAFGLIAIAIGIVGGAAYLFGMWRDHRRRLAVERQRRRRHRQRKSCVFVGTEESMQRNSTQKPGDLWILTDRGNEVRFVPPTQRWRPRH